MSELTKVLVIQTAFPGDAILTLPLIQELKKKNPFFSIDVLCIPVTSEIFAASPYVNSVFPFDKKGKQKSFFAFFRYIKELRSNKYKVVFSPHRSIRSAIISLNVGAQETYGFENSALKFAFKHTVKYDVSSHEVKRNLEFVNGDYSNDKWRIIPEVKISEDSKNKVQKFFKDKNIKKFITIAPGSIWETKKYPVEYFRHIIDHFINLRYQIIIIGGNQDKELCEAIHGEDDESIIIAAGEFSFIETIEVLKSSSLLICNDSAPTHLGVCADIPVLTIYCSTIPEFGFYPYNLKSGYISYGELFCKPCGIHGYKSCPLDNFKCGKLLDPKMVIDKAEKLLSYES